MDFDRLFTDVLKIDSTIRYAAIQNRAGEKITASLLFLVTMSLR